MPEFGAHDAGNNGNGNNAQRIGSDASAAKAAVHDESADYGGQPEHQPKGGQGEMPNMQKGNHRSSSIDAGATDYSLSQD
jgi:hypothetical protein